MFHTTRAPPSFLGLPAHGLGCAAAAAPYYHVKLLVVSDGRPFNIAYAYVLLRTACCARLPRLGSAAAPIKQRARFLTLAILSYIFVVFNIHKTMKDCRRISMHDVYKHLEQIHGIKSVPSPCAQTTTPCGSGSPGISNGFDLEVFMSNASGLSVLEKAVIELMFMHGLRISEVLNIDQSDISKSGAIRIKALKGSSFRVVQPALFKEFWLKNCSQLLPLRTVYSRFYFYRLFKRLGLYAYFGTNSNASVTHYFRHLKGLDIQESFNDWALTQSVLGHKNVNSTHYYGQKKQK